MKLRTSGIINAERAISHARLRVRPTRFMAEVVARNPSANLADCAGFSNGEFVTEFAACKYLTLSNTIFACHDLAADEFGIGEGAGRMLVSRVAIAERK